MAWLGKCSIRLQEWHEHSFGLQEGSPTTHRRVRSCGARQVAFCRKVCDIYKTMKILIAEDDPDSRDLLSWLLQKLGYQVIAASNGKEAWDAYRKGRFRIVISDVLMPEIDGLELCRRIRLHKQS